MGIFCPYKEKQITQISYINIKFSDKLTKKTQIRRVTLSSRLNLNQSKQTLISDVQSIKPTINQLSATQFELSGGINQSKIDQVGSFKQKIIQQIEKAFKSPINVMEIKQPQFNFEVDQLTIKKTMAQFISAALTAKKKISDSQQKNRLDVYFHWQDIPKQSAKKISQLVLQSLIPSHIQSDDSTIISQLTNDQIQTNQNHDH